MSSILNETCIVGIGETAYRRGEDRPKTDFDLQLEASLAAIAEAGLKPGDIDGIVCPIVGGKADDFAANLGLKDLRYAVTSHTGGAACVAALASAAMAVAAGVARHVLVPAGWRGYSGPRARGLASNSSDLGIGSVVRDFYAPHGAVSAVHQYALIASRYLSRYKVPVEALGMVAVEFRRNAQLNPLALMRGKELTLDEYLASTMISTPFRRFDCSLETDGAAALIVASASKARDMPQPPVYIMAVEEARPYPIDEFANRQNMVEIGLTQAAPRAFARAGVTPGDVDFLQVYDSFTINVLRQIEAAGFCQPGEAGQFVLDGNIGLRGSLPVNTNGGMLAEAHIMGMNNVLEAVRQLRGAAKDRQVQNAELGVVTGLGGGWATSGIAILRR